MISWLCTVRQLQFACALLFLVALAGCNSMYTLEDRIRDLEAQGYGTSKVEPRARPQPHAKAGKLRKRQIDAAESPIAVQPAAEQTPMSRGAADERQARDGSLTTGESDAAAARVSRWRPVPADYQRSPEANSPEAAREEAAVEKDRQLNRRIRSICRGC